jgi:hypothetical protein
VVLRAARNATGSENATASAVPATLMASVSSNGLIQLRQSLKLGGSISPSRLNRLGTPSARRAPSNNPT